jgi:hypothetical protein
MADVYDVSDIMSNNYDMVSYKSSSTVSPGAALPVVWLLT